MPYPPSTRERRRGDFFAAAGTFAPKLYGARPQAVPTVAGSCTERTRKLYETGG